MEGLSVISPVKFGFDKLFPASNKLDITAFTHSRQNLFWLESNKRFFCCSTFHDASYQRGLTQVQVMRSVLPCIKHWAERTKTAPQSAAKNHQIQNISSSHVPLTFLTGKKRMLTLDTEHTPISHNISSAGKPSVLLGWRTLYSECKYYTII